MDENNTQTKTYLPDSDEDQSLAAKFYSKDYTKKWPELTLKRAKAIGDEIGVDWQIVDLGQFIEGIKEEMEHGSEFGENTKVHDDDYVTSGRIAYAHLIERPDYYTALAQLEAAGDEKFADDPEKKKQWVADLRLQFQDDWEAASQG